MLKSPEFYSSLRRGNLDATLCLKPPSTASKYAAGYYWVKHCPILIILGTGIPEGCWLKMMLSTVTSRFVSTLHGGNKCKSDAFSRHSTTLWHINKLLISESFQFL